MTPRWRAATVICVVLLIGLSALPAQALAIREFPIPSNGQPLRITLGPDGNMWFSEYEENRIGRISSTGVITEFSLPPTGLILTGSRRVPTGTCGLQPGPPLGA